MGRLPAWVQVSSASAPLYTSDSGVQLAGSKLTRYTFLRLRVVGGGAARLQVDMYDDQGHQGARGWVDPDNVLPSAPGTDWYVSTRATPLCKAADATSDPLRTVDQFSPLQLIDGSLTDHDRLLQLGTRYAQAMKSANDPRGFAQALSDAGYSTDPTYADKLIQLMNAYNLYRLDA